MSAICRHQFISPQSGCPVLLFLSGVWASRSPEVGLCVFSAVRSVLLAGESYLDPHRLWTWNWRWCVSLGSQLEWRWCHDPGCTVQHVAGSSQSAFLVSLSVHSGGKATMPSHLRLHACLKNTSICTLSSVLTTLLSTMFFSLYT